jgi:hypothetical protein
LKKITAGKSSFLLIALVIIVSGCGLKGNPVPYPTFQDKRQLVKNIEALSENEAIILKWNFQDSAGLISYIGIERSEAGSPGNECKDCPRTFTRIGQVSVKSTKLDDKELRTLSFIDKNVTKGKIYTYRLMLCEDNGNCTDTIAVEKNLINN